MSMVGAANAQSLVVTHNTGTINSTQALTGYATTGAMMDGMTVTAYFAGGGSETRAWTDLSATGGGVSGSMWSLSESGDTFSSNWSLISTGAVISKLVIDAGRGDSVFDTTFIGDVTGTDGSARGANFSISGANSWDIVATYQDTVALTGQAPVGDLFRTLTIDFSRGAAFRSGSLAFLADTDNLRFAGDIRPSVPEPETYGMLMAGLGLIGAIARRRKQKA